MSPLLQDPFGDDPNDLPMQSYQRTINNRLIQFLYIGERDYYIPDASPEAYASAAKYKESVDGTVPATKALEAAQTNVSSNHPPPRSLAPLEIASSGAGNASPALSPVQWVRVPAISQPEESVAPELDENLATAEAKLDGKEDEDERGLNFKWVKGVDDSFVQQDLRRRGRKKRNSHSETVRLF